MELNAIVCCFLVYLQIYGSSNAEAVTCELSSTFKAKSVNPEGKTIFRVGETVRITCTEERWFSTKETSKTYTCQEDGQWDSIPTCQAVTCELSSTFKANRVIPKGKTIFRAGEKVRITCTEEGWFSTKDVSKTFTCKENGEWDSTPVCQVSEITCDRPLDQHVSNYYWRSMKLGEKKLYSCDKGYYKMETEATCTRDGLTPKPLCAEIVCAEPDIPNAEIIRGQKQKYKLDSAVQYRCRTGFEPQGNVQIICKSPGRWMDIQRCTEKQEECQELYVKNGVTYSQTSNKQEIFYSCNKGFKPFTGKWWSSVTCSKGSWSDVPRCIREEECGALPSVQNGKVNPNDQETAEVVCEPGFVSPQRFIKCISGTWEEPSCNMGEKCGIPPYVENAVITSKPQELYIYGSSVTYACKIPFLMNGKSTVFCNNGKWEATPTCEVVEICGIPSFVENAVITSKPQDFYIHGSSVTYACQSLFSMSGKSTVFCNNGKWEETPTCEAQCHRPYENYMALENDKDMYDNKEILKYKCVEPYTEIPGGEWTCENGKWTGKFVCTSKICPPPPYVENGDFVSRNPADLVTTDVYYQCQASYVLSEQRRYYKCENGKWQTPPRCLKPCEITPSLLEKHNMEPIPQTLYIQHSKSHYVYCKSGFFAQRTIQFYITITCSDGTLNIESCQKYN